MSSFTRRQMLLGGSAIGLAAAAGGFAVGSATGWDWFGGSASAADDAGGGVRAHEFATRPDLRPPKVEVLRRAAGVTDGHIMVTPYLTGEGPIPDGIQAGPLIVDNYGEPVWFHPQSEMRVDKLTDQVADLKMQRYQGEPVLTYWRGDYKIPPGFGRGEFVILDSSYQEIKVVRAANDLIGDLHEFVITEADTALLAAYRQADADGEPVWEGVIQEIDLANDSVLFEWHSAEHIAPDESMAERPADAGERFEYFHINSVAEDGDDALLVSARNTSAIYRLDRSSGEVLWRLGGSHGDFAMRPGTTFKWQHDARRLPDGTLSLFDNATPPEQSRALVLALDESSMVAELRREHSRPDGAASASQGNAQFQPDGRVLVGWGSEAYVTEFTAAGNVLFDARFGDNMDSYRSHRAVWQGTPSDRPAAAAFHSDNESMTVYASWNGATEVATWRVLTGSSPDDLSPATEVPRTGFETQTTVAEQQSHAAVQALDSTGTVLGTSEPVQPSS